MSHPVGPTSAKVMIVGDCPSNSYPGTGLARMLHEAGFMVTECFQTYVARTQAPGGKALAFMPKEKKHITPDCMNVRGQWVKPDVAAGLTLLEKEIELIQPNLIIALGEIALWALTGKRGIDDWRGSTLVHESSGATVIPTYAADYVFRDSEARPLMVRDFRRAFPFRLSKERHPPEYNFLVAPTYPQAWNALNDVLLKLVDGPMKLSVDIETRAGHIACLGIGTSNLDAFCIPFMCVEDKSGYWSEEMETNLVYLLYQVLTHPNARVVGQNFIYDAQYIWRHWHFVPNFDRDTMLAQHVCFLGMSKGLDFLASMYCEYYVFWKNESKEWYGNVGETQLWTYNCKDCVITYEVDTVLQETVDKLNLREQHDFQQGLFYPVLRAMTRGLRRDNTRQKQMATTLFDEITKRESIYVQMLGHTLNPASPVQMQKLFYDDLGQKVIFNRKTHTPTLDDKALTKIGQREPLLRPLIKNIQEHRSLNVFLSTFVNAQTAWDGRMRSSFNIAGTETLRFSSSQDAFGSGANLQNIPQGHEDDDPHALQLPNIRQLFVPDTGMTFFDCDLDRADLQVVVWEADDEELREALLAGVDLHSLNAQTLFNLRCSVEAVKKLYPDKRQLAKSWVHGTNYGGRARTMAATCGITVHEADRLRDRWFAAHPGIRAWHERTEIQLQTKRFVSNPFGYKRFYFGRVDDLLPEALAWQPQSTVAVVINKVFANLYDRARWIEVLLQVHDSLGGQFPTERKEEALGMIQQCGQVVIPYPRPLIIPIGTKTSTLSWGDCK